MEERAPVVVARLVGLLCAATGAVVSGVSRRAAGGRLRRNAVAGIRTRATLRSDAAWQAGHAAARGLSDAAAVVFVGTGVLAAVVRAAPWFAGVVLVGMTAGAVLLVVGAARAGGAADRADG